MSTEEQTVSPESSVLSTQTVAHFGRGVLMGLADVVPGVSGGTVALIVGIYERLVTAISHADGHLLGLIGHRRWKEASQYLDLQFLVPLGLGVVGGVTALGTMMHILLDHYFSYTMAAFFGMIAASCWLVTRMVHRWGIREYVLIVAGAFFAWWLMQQPALTNPPDQLWYVFLCGAIAICAMILPGVSGAFILLILGKYHDLTGIIKETVHLNLSVTSIVTIGVFGTGCLLGLVSFSKLLKWLLKHYGSATMAVLCGFMAGSLYKVWPFQIDTTPEVREFKHKVFKPVFSGIAIDTHFWIVLGIMVISGAIVLWVEHFATRLARNVVHDDGEQA